jgi:hypothetical protein
MRDVIMEHDNDLWLGVVQRSSNHISFLLLSETPGIWM